LIPFPHNAGFVEPLVCFPHVCSEAKRLLFAARISDLSDCSKQIHCIIPGHESATTAGIIGCEAERLTSIPHHRRGILNGFAFSLLGHPVAICPPQKIRFELFGPKGISEVLEG
jgi:hypothetical protein